VVTVRYSFPDRIQNMQRNISQYCHFSGNGFPEAMQGTVGNRLFQETL